MAALAQFLVSLGSEFLLQGDHERGARLNEEATGCSGAWIQGCLEFVLDNLGWAALIEGDHERAKSLHEESLVLCKELGDKLIASESLEGGCMSGAKGEAERAARLFGAAEALREAVGYQHMPEEDALREPYCGRALPAGGGGVGARVGRRASDVTRAGHRIRPLGTKPMTPSTPEQTLL